MINYIKAGLIILLLYVCFQVNSQPVLDKVLVADVSDRSFSLLFIANEPGTPGLMVYTDESMQTSIPNLNQLNYPVHTGLYGVNSIDGVSPKQLIVDAAKEAGIVKITVSGLNQNSRYFVKYYFQSDIDLETTICPDDGVVSCNRSSDETVQVDTMSAISRLKDNQVYINDTLLYLDGEAQAGEILLLSVENTKYPLSMFVGDGMPLPYVAVDLNNLYSKTDLANYKVNGSDMRDGGDYGEGIMVMRYSGQNTADIKVMQLGVINNNGSLVEVFDRRLGDCNSDGRVDGYDGLLLQRIIQNSVSPGAYTGLAFHPYLCNLFVEEYFNGIVNGITIDSSDYDQMSNILVGKESSDNVPTMP